MSSNTITVTLSSPIDAGDGKKIDALTFREAELGDMIASDSVTGDTAKTAAMLAGMCGMPLPVMKKLKMRDITKILREVAPLLGNEAPQTDAG